MARHIHHFHICHHIEVHIYYVFVHIHHSSSLLVSLQSLPVLSNLYFLLRIYSIFLLLISQSYKIRLLFSICILYLILTFCNRHFFATAVPTISRPFPNCFDVWHQFRFPLRKINALVLDNYEIKPENIFYLTIRVQTPTLPSVAPSSNTKKIKITVNRRMLILDAHILYDFMPLYFVCWFNLIKWMDKKKCTIHSNTKWYTHGTQFNQRLKTKCMFNLRYWPFLIQIKLKKNQQIHRLMSMKNRH